MSPAPACRSASGGPSPIAPAERTVRLPKSADRCGVYELRFANGDRYVGQAIDVVTRFSTHRLNYPDIVEVAFWRVSRGELDLSNAPRSVARRSGARACATWRTPADGSARVTSTSSCPRLSRTPGWCRHRPMSSTRTHGRSIRPCAAKPCRFQPTDRRPALRQGPVRAPPLHRLDAASSPAHRTQRLVDQRPAGHARRTPVSVFPSPSMTVMRAW